MINDLCVVRDDRVELLKRLERVPGQAQVNVDQPQVVDRLYTLHLLRKGGHPMLCAPACVARVFDCR